MAGNASIVRVDSTVKITMSTIQCIMEDSLWLFQKIASRHLNVCEAVYEHVLSLMFTDLYSATFIQ